MRHCENPLKVESKMEDDVQIFNMWTPICLEWLELESSNLVYALTTRSNFAKTR